MASDSTIEVLQGELERLFGLQEMMRLSSDLLGFEPAQVGGVGSKGAFARSLVGYCVAQDAVAALIDAIVLSSSDADSGLRALLKTVSNGELRPGTRIDGMRVVKKIGEGGLSVVYLVESEGQAGELQRAALKVIRPEFARDRGAVHRFTTASRMMRSLESPGLARIFNVGQLEDARPWVAAAYMTGQTLAQRIARTGSLHINEALPILVGVLRGLSALHQRGMLHGDLRTENVFVMRGGDDGGGEPFGVLVDGGSDRLLARSPAASPTKGKGLMSLFGTAKSFAPEQARGLEPDQRTDLYQVGTLIYETLAGRPPFEGEAAIDVIAQHLSALAAPPSTYARKGWVSPALDELVLRTLAKDPADRFQSALELLEALERTAKKLTVQRPLDEGAFQEARRALLADASNQERAERIEDLCRQCGAFGRAAEVLREVAHVQREPETKLALLFRAARIFDTELKDAVRAESTYQQILELDPGNEVALRGVESGKRALGDHEGLIGCLLDRIDREQSVDMRKALLHEVAAIYEKQLRDSDNALVAWTQALTNDATDEDAIKSIERLAGNVQTRWSEVIETLSQGAQQAHAALFSDDQAQRDTARQQLVEAQSIAQQTASALQEALAERAHQVGAEESGLAAQFEAAAQEHALANNEVEAADAHLGEAAARVGELAQAADAAVEEAEHARAKAEAHVAAYEELEAESGDTPTPERQAELDQIAGEAEALVAQAEAIEAEAEQYAATLDAARAAIGEVQLALDAAQARASEIEQALLALQRAQQSGGGVAELTVDERATLAAAKSSVAQAQAQVDALDDRDETERAAKRERDLANLAASYVVLGRWYGARLGRPDIGLSCFSQTIELDASNEAAYDGIIDLYRGSQSWSELSAALLQRADNARSPLKGRDYRTEAALVIANKLNDQAQARAQLERVLADDPDHPQAQRTLGELLRGQQDWPALAAVLERQADSVRGKERCQALLALAELYEDKLDELDKAAAKYQAASEADPHELSAYKGLERLYARKENYEGLITSLRAQVDLVATPKQRIALLDRIGLMLEEEFVDHAQASECFEKITAIDPSHEGANAALTRLYRTLQRFEDLVKTLTRHAGTTTDASRKVELMLHAARTLSIDIGSPERAIDVYEAVLGIDDNQPEALSELARLKSTAGDVASAVSAVERLADQEQDPRKQAALRIRAARLLEDSGDRDGAIMRYRRALDLDRLAGDAAAALREIYKARGDARGASEMLVHSIGIAEGDSQRAALLGELGAIYRDQLDEPDQAKVAFEEAINLDATNTVAAAGLARIAFAAGSDAEGIEHFRSISARLGELPAQQAAELCAEAAASHQNLGDTEQAVAALKRATELVPESLEFSERHAGAVLVAGDAQSAERLYERMLQQRGDDLEIADKVRLTLALGEAYLLGKHQRKAVEAFGKVLSWLPDDGAALDGLTRSHEQAGAWKEVVNLLQLRSRRTLNEDEMFDLMVKTGDVFLEKLRDRDAASQTYVMALDVKPDSRNLLTKLMGVYSEGKDWPRLIEIILRIADMVRDSVQLAKYFNTAATIAHTELGRFDEAANYYESALSHMAPSAGDAQFSGLVQCLTENQDWERLERAYETRIGRLRQAGAEPGRIASLLDACGDIVQERLGRLADALRMYEESLELQPDNEARRAALTAIYTKEPKRFFQRAVSSHRHYLAADAYRVDSLQSLRKIYTSGKKPDESWCVCQALRCLKMADVDEEKFFKKYRLTRLPKMKQPVTDQLWRELIAHPAQDPMLTAIFATLQPVVVQTQAQKLSAFGVSENLRIDLENDPSAMARMIAYVGETTATNLPPVYHCPQDPGGLSFLFVSPPAVGIGEGAKAGGPQQALAFVAARHLSYFRQGHFLRQLVPTGTGLRAWLIGAIRGVAPRFPAPANMEAQVKECTDAIARQLVGPQRDALRSMTQKLLDAAPELDMKAWMTGMDLTADRVGFILSNDLKIANAVIEASPEDASSVGRKDRLRELLAYSISEEYFELRKRTGIALGG